MNRSTSRAAKRLETFKKRLRWVIQTTGDGSKAALAKTLTRSGFPATRATIDRWLDEESAHCPDALYLIGLLMDRPTVSIDWLSGRKPAESIDEEFIESRI